MNAFLENHIDHAIAPNSSIGRSGREELISSTSSDLEPVRFAVMYDGLWEHYGGNKYEFVATKCTVAMVPPSILYEDFRTYICSVIGIDSMSYKITMKFNYLASIPVLPIEISDDTSLKFFLKENCDFHTRSPLCVSFEPVMVEPAIVEPAMVGASDVDHPHPYNESISQHISEDIPVLPSFNRPRVDNFNGASSSDCYAHLDSLSEEGVLEENVPDNATNNDDFGEPNVPDNEQSIPENDCNDVINEEVSVRDEDERVQADCSDFSLQTNAHGAVIEKGGLFRTKKELQEKVSMVALNMNFEFRTKRSTKDLLVLQCLAPQCKWYLRATKMKNIELFVVKKYVGEHTCSLVVPNRDHRQASSKLIAQAIKSKFTNVKRCYRPNDIIEDVRQEYGYSMSYHKAWRAKECALEDIWGSPEESFRMLPSYCWTLEQKNPGTITHVEIDANNRFKYFFMALGACIQGFRSSIRPVLAVDGTFLKGKYRGTLFIASGLDGNDQIYPLAFCVGDSENDASWYWFLSKLHDMLGEIDEMVIVSDRSPCILKGVASAFPNAVHGVCVRHLKMNVNAHFKNHNVEELINKAAYSYRVSEFNHNMQLIHSVHSGVGKYLEETGYEKWARALFNGKRYGIMTTNIAESMNALLKDARVLPIVKLAEEIRSGLQRWFCERRQKAGELSSILTKAADKEFKERYRQARPFSVHPIDEWEFHVTDGEASAVVNLWTRTCSCRVFDLDKFPCNHAIAAARLKRIPFYDLCSPYYSRNCLCLAYADSIFPVGDEEEWEVPEEVKGRIVLPPEMRRPSGRPRGKRIPSIGEEPSRNKCSRCGEAGHNRGTCRNPIPLHRSVPSNI